MQINEAYNNVRNAARNCALTADQHAAIQQSLELIAEAINNGVKLAEENKALLAEIETFKKPTNGATPVQLVGSDGKLV